MMSHSKEGFQHNEKRLCREIPSWTRFVLLLPVLTRIYFLVAMMMISFCSCFTRIFDMPVTNNGSIPRSIMLARYQRVQFA